MLSLKASSHQQNFVVEAKRLTKIKEGERNIFTFCTFLLCERYLRPPPAPTMPQ